MMKRMKKVFTSWRFLRIVFLLVLTASLISLYVVQSKAYMLVEPINKITSFLTNSKPSQEQVEPTVTVETGEATESTSNPVTKELEPDDGAGTGVVVVPTTATTKKEVVVVPETVQVAKPTAVPVAKSFPYISSTDVLLALNQYRSNHRVHQLIEHHNLCEYAQKRVNDLVAYGGLDHHQGFSHDFANDNRPSQLENYPGRTIGENLAYQHCRNMTTGEGFIAESAPALIEWCFDSSTAGHREAQLNSKFNNVCVRSQSGYFVIIFGD